jgi:hypothetical protein
MSSVMLNLDLINTMQINFSVQVHVFVRTKQNINIMFNVASPYLMVSDLNARTSYVGACRTALPSGTKKNQLHATVSLETYSGTMGRKILGMSGLTHSQKFFDPERRCLDKTSEEDSNKHCVLVSRLDTGW